MSMDFETITGHGSPWWVKYPGQALTRVKNNMKPKVIFGCPIQGEKDPKESWWLVPVTLKRRPLSGKKLEDARVYARLFDPDNPGTGAIELLWRDIDRITTSTRSTLRVGDVRFIPVVWRREGADQGAYITDVEFVNSNKQKKMVAVTPRPGQVKIILFVKSGDYSDKSSPYIIRNHAMESNGHFALEVQYEGLGTGAFLIGSERRSGA
jgi:hypothetical protein